MPSDRPGKRGEIMTAAMSLALSSRRLSTMPVLSESEVSSITSIARNSRRGSLFTQSSHHSESPSIPMNPLFEVPSIHSECETGGHPFTSPANGKRDSVYQPFRRVTLCWDNLTVTKLAQEEKFSFFSKKFQQTQLQSTDQPILRGVSGVVYAGDLTAILGPKGAGKTMLLKTISGRIMDSVNSFKVEGRIYANNQEANEDILQSFGYVTPDYPFHGALTVKEHLVFQAYLRIDERYSRDEKAALVDDMIKEIGLSNCEDSTIGLGDRLDGLSLLQKRMLALATETLSNPAVLCCDEPLEGLNGFEAETIMEYLRNMAGRGKIVVCSLTRPTSEAFSKCDKVAVLYDGRSGFFGGVDEAQDYFASVGYSLPSSSNPADFYVGCLSGTSTMSPLERAEQAKFICDKFLVSGMFDKIRRKLENTARMCRVCSTAKTIKPKSPWQTEWMFQLMILLWRGGLAQWRDPFLLPAKLFLNVFAGLLIGLFFLQQNPATQEGAENINGALWLLICFLSIFPLFGIIAVVLPEMQLFQDEDDRGNVHATFANFISRCLLQLPQHVFFPWLLITLSYWLVGFHTSVQAYAVACCVAVLTSLTAEGFFMFLATATKRIDLTLALSFLIGLPMFLLNGFLPRLGLLSKWISWASYLSWFHYAMDALSENQWKEMEIVHGSSVNGSNIIPATGSDLYVIREQQSDNLIFDCGMLFVISTAFHVLTLILLLMRLI